MTGKIKSNLAKESMTATYNNSYLAARTGNPARQSEMRRHYAMIKEYYRGGVVVEIGAAEGTLLKMFTAFPRFGVDLIGNWYRHINDVSLMADCVIMIDLIEHLVNPMQYLRDIHSHMNKSALLYICTPDLTSPVARLMGRQWYEFKNEHLFLLSRGNIETILQQAGFRTRLVASWNKLVNSRSSGRILLRDGRWYGRLFKVVNINLRIPSHMICVAEKE